MILKLYTSSTQFILGFNPTYLAELRAYQIKVPIGRRIIACRDTKNRDIKNRDTKNITLLRDNFFLQQGTEEIKGSTEKGINYSTLERF